MAIENVPGPLTSQVVFKFRDLNCFGGVDGLELNHISEVHVRPDFIQDIVNQLRRKRMIYDDNVSSLQLRLDIPDTISGTAVCRCNESKI